MASRAPHTSPASLPASAELVGLGRPRALVRGWSGSSLGHVVLEQVDMEWEEGRAGGLPSNRKFSKS